VKGATVIATTGHPEQRALCCQESKCVHILYKCAKQHGPTPTWLTTGAPP
jgi:hypothetical protein